MIKIGLHLFAMLLLTSTAAFAQYKDSNGSAGGVPGNSKVQIELDIFSGRPNPKWYFDAESVERLTTLLETQQPTSHDSEKVPALGFRGFQITVEEGATRRRYKVFRDTLGSQLEHP